MIEMELKLFKNCYLIEIGLQFFRTYISSE